MHIHDGCAVYHDLSCIALAELRVVAACPSIFMFVPLAEPLARWRHRVSR